MLFLRYKHENTEKASPFTDTLRANSKGEHKAFLVVPKLVKAF
jgi:hypothetical protein